MKYILTTHARRLTKSVDQPIDADSRIVELMENAKSVTVRCALDPSTVEGS